LTSAIHCKNTSTSGRFLFYLYGGSIEVQALNSTQNTGQNAAGIFIQSSVAKGASFCQIANATNQLYSIYFWYGTQFFRSSNVIGCSSAENNNGLVYFGGSASTEFTDCVFRGNSVPGDLIFFVDSGALALTRCSVQAFSFSGAVTTLSLTSFSEIDLRLYSTGECEGALHSSDSSSGGSLCRARSKRSPGRAGLILIFVLLLGCDIALFGSPKEWHFRLVVRSR
jgi:hypothetical protein